MSEPRKRRAGGADAAVWAVVHTSTRRLAAKTVETLQAQKDVAALVARYRRVETPQLAGRLFEIMHALSFNLDAAGKDSALRARVTEWVGRQQSAVDLEIVSEGRVAVSYTHLTLPTTPYV